MNMSHYQSTNRKVIQKMQDTFIVIKMLKDRGPLKNFNDSQIPQSTLCYNVQNEIDRTTVVSLPLSQTTRYKIVFVTFDVIDREKPERCYKWYEIFVGDCNVEQFADTINIHFCISGRTSSQLVINNFINASGIDLKSDFDFRSYVRLESSQELLKQLQFATQKPYKASTNTNQNYPAFESQAQLNPLAQKNEDCLRALAIRQPSGIRGEFQRDRDRVIHAKAFRRLVDKAQIFTSSRGDHFRTRMTHTLEVSQIARGIATALNVNVDLTEAIALAHDIGHTPFGHQGERTLDDILKNRIRLIPDADKINFGGFKHNYHGLRVLAYLEEKYLEHEGLDLSYQVLEGVLKHTKFNEDRCMDENCQQCGNNKETCGRNCCVLSQFLVQGNPDRLYPQDKFPHSIEGQIVFVADEIAQRGHDLDDALAANKLSLDALAAEVSIKKMEPIYQIILELKKSLHEYEAKGRLFDASDMIRARLVPEILDCFIKDVIQHSSANLRDCCKDPAAGITVKLVDFSQQGAFMASYLEKVIARKVLNSYEVSRFDDKGRRIVSALFAAYYNNPRLLPDRTLQRIAGEIRCLATESFAADALLFRNSDPKLVSQELQSICHGNAEDPLIREKRKILVRNIVDTIAGMTDHFALSEYNAIIASTD